VLVVDEPLSEWFIYGCNQHEEIGRICGVQHVESIPQCQANRQHQRRGERIAVFESVSQKTTSLRRWSVTPHSDVIEHLSLRLRVQRRANHSDFISGLCEGLRFAAHSCVAWIIAVLEKQQHSIPGMFFHTSFLLTLSPRFPLHLANNFRGA
jgi:hypothetical protein